MDKNLYFNNYICVVKLIAYGVPQGSILNTSSFMLYTYDLAFTSNAIFVVMFADDTNTPISGTDVYTTELHDDVIKWKQFPRYWPFVPGIHRSPVNSPHKGRWRGALMFSLICVWINGWVNNREAGDLRRYRAHYDVIVMMFHIELMQVSISLHKHEIWLNVDKWNYLISKKNNSEKYAHQNILQMHFTCCDWR